MNLIAKKIQQNINNYQTKLRTQFLLDPSLGYEQTTFLAGVSRSGTTWFSDLINYKNDYRYIFEPFYEKKIDLCQHFRPKQYLKPDNNDLKFIEPVRLILSGQVKNSWSDRFNRKIVSHQRLIKSIRANLFLKWLHLNFPKLPIILLLRHPCAVAVSKLRLDWQRSLDKYLAQDDLMSDFFADRQKQIEESEQLYQKTGDSFENHIFSWCIENYVPLKQFYEGEIYIAFYESFCVNPEQEIKKLFAFLDKKYDQQIFANFSRASKLSRKDSPVVTGGSLIDSWRKHLTDEQVKRAIEIVSLFGLDKIYNHNSLPEQKNLQQIMKKD